VYIAYVWLFVVQPVSCIGVMAACIISSHRLLTELDEGFCTKTEDWYPNMSLFNSMTATSTSLTGLTRIDYLFLPVASVASCLGCSVFQTRLAHFNTAMQSVNLSHESTKYCLYFLLHRCTQVSLWKYLPVALGLHNTWNLKAKYWNKLKKCTVHVIG